MKKLSGLIILLLVHAACFGQVNIHIQNGGRAATQEWVKVYLETLLNRIEAPVDTGGTVTPPTPVCSGPNIESVSSVSQTGLTFVWSGLNVPDIVWTISDASGALRTGSVSSSSITRSITYNSIGYGTFSLSIKGIGCSTTPTPVSFTLTAPPVTVTSGRRIYMNTTGYGFSTTDPFGINEEWRKRIDQFNNLNYNGVSFSGINGVRLLVRWLDYEPTEGVFNDAKLIAAINFCKARNLKFAVCFWALRSVGDNFIPDGERMCGSRGSTDYFLLEGNKYLPAPYSTTGKQKLKNAVKHLAQVMSAYPNDVDYISLGFGETEEVYMPGIKSNTGQRLSQTGYSNVDRAAWPAYAASHGATGQQPVVSPNPADAWTTGDAWNTTFGKVWYSFISEGLASVHAAFRDGVHEGGMKVCGFYPDAGAAQSSWGYAYKLDQIFAGCDIMYSSEGGTRYNIGDKIFSADVNLGTFPTNEPAIEFDPEDLSVTGTTEYGNATDSGLLLNYGSSFFKRGGKIIHFAMAFSYGEDGHNNNITPLAPALWTLQNDYVKSTTIPSIPTGTDITFPITSYSGDQSYRSAWSNNGGGLNKQVKIKIQ